MHKVCINLRDSLMSTIIIIYSVYSNRTQAKKNLICTQLESKQFQLRCNRIKHELSATTNSGYQWYRASTPGPDHHEGSLRKAL